MNELLPSDVPVKMEQSSNFLVRLQTRLSRYLGFDVSFAARAGSWWILGKGGILLLSFATLVVLARWLPRDAYGAYQYVLSVLAVFSVASLNSLDLSVVRGIAQGKDGTLRRGLREKVRWGTLAALAALITAAWYFSQGNAVLGAAFFIGGLFAPFRESFEIYWTYWNGTHQFGRQAKYVFLSFLIHTIVMVPVIFFTRSVPIILCAFLIAHTLADRFFYYRTVRELRNNDIDEGAITFGKHLSLMDAVDVAASYLDKIIIWKFLGDSSLAVYSLAQMPVSKLIDMVPIIPVAISKLGTLDISTAKGKIRHVFWRMFLVSIPLAVFLACIAPFVFSIFFPTYLDAVPYFQMLLVLLALSPFALPYSALLSNMSRHALYVVRIGVPLLKIVLLVIFVSHWGIVGAIAALVVAELCKGALTYSYFLKI